MRARFTVAPVTERFFAQQIRSCFLADLKSSTISLEISSRYLPRKNRLSVLQFSSWRSYVFGLCCCVDHSRNCLEKSSNLGIGLDFANPARRSDRSVLRFASMRCAAVLFREPDDS